LCLGGVRRCAAGRLPLQAASLRLGVRPLLRPALGRTDLVAATPFSAWQGCLPFVCFAADFLELHETAVVEDAPGGGGSRRAKALRRRGAHCCAAGRCGAVVLLRGCLPLRSRRERPDGEACAGARQHLLAAFASWCTWQCSSCSPASLSASSLAALGSSAVLLQPRRGLGGAAPQGSQCFFEGVAVLFFVIPLLIIAVPCWSACGRGLRSAAPSCRYAFAPAGCRCCVLAALCMRPRVL